MTADANEKCDRCGRGRSRHERSKHGLLLLVAIYEGRALDPNEWVSPRAVLGELRDALRDSERAAAPAAPEKAGPPVLVDGDSLPNDRIMAWHKAWWCCGKHAEHETFAEAENCESGREWRLEHAARAAEPKTEGGAT